MDYLQMWWEEKYPKAGVRKITNVSEGIITLEDLQDFEKWLVKKLTICSVSCQRGQLLLGNAHYKIREYTGDSVDMQGFIRRDCNNCN